MSVIVLLIVAGGTVAAGFLAAFAWAVRSGQFDDTCTPAIRMLLEDRGQTQRLMRLPSEGGSHREGGGNERGFRLQAEESIAKWGKDEQ
jgi:cbb3-type cytochrome oxidase maturation protein